MAQALTIGQLAQATGVSAKDDSILRRRWGAAAPEPNAGRVPPVCATGSAPAPVHPSRSRPGAPLQHLKALAAVLDGGPRAMVRPRLLPLVRAQLAAVQEQITELQLLQGRGDRPGAAGRVGSPASISTAPRVARATAPRAGSAHTRRACS
jgi:hypothetical protein